MNYYIFDDNGTIIIVKELSEELARDNLLNPEAILLDTKDQTTTVIYRSDT